MQYISEVISASALLISILAFIESRRDSRLKHAPALVGHEQEGPVDYAYIIQNKGGGPAYFEKVEFFLDGKPLRETTLREAIANLLKESGIRFTLSVTHPAQQNVMQPGERITLVRIAVPPEDAVKLKSIPSSRFVVRISFRSAHGKRQVWSNED